MSTFLITQTQFADVRPIDPSIELSSNRLRQLLNKHLLAEDVVQTEGLFADPEPVMGAAATDWYTDYPETAVAISELDPEDRDAILRRVGQICAKISVAAEGLTASATSNRDADFLRAAISVPDNGRYIFVIGEKPVIVAWGHKPASASRAPVPAGLWVKSATLSSNDTGATSRPVVDADTMNNMQVASVGGVGTAAAFGWVAWLLWALFLILLLIILWLLLRGCSVGWPQASLAQRLGLLTQCPAISEERADAVLQGADQEVALQQAIRDAELDLAESAQNCRVVRRREDVARREALMQSQPPDPTTDAAITEADDRVREAGGQTGEMQVVLQWDGPSDLDMSVSCGQGNIAYNRRTACEGGELDVDANHEVHMDRPVENIHWAEMPPTGAYGVRVRNHNSRNDPRSKIPFTVLVRQGEQERTYQGEVSEGQTVSVADIVVE